jgi:Ca2+-binding EF-hand superfamily protein
MAAVRISADEIRDIMAQERMASKAKRRAAPAIKTRLTDEQVRSVFAMFDAGAVGSVPVSEVDLMLRSLGITSDMSDVPQLLEDSGVDKHADTITLAEFTAVVQGSAVEQNSAAEAERVFSLIDITGSGEITFEGLQAALEEADARVSDEELREVIRYCGLSRANEGKSVTREDWKEVMAFIAEVGI